jgi:hypothetical protein
MKKFNKKGNSSKDLLKNRKLANIHSKLLTLNEDEILVALSKSPGTETSLSKSEKAKYLKRIKKVY